MIITKALPIIIILTGGYFIIKTRAFFILHPIRTVKDMLSDIGNEGSFRSLCLALAGTLGVGNIVGVAAGISIGGAGSVFWLLLSSLFSSALKYAEITAASDPLIKDGSGMIALVRIDYGKHLSNAYAFLYIALSLTLGSAVQINAITECSAALTNAPLLVTLIPLIAVIVITVLGGTERIERAVSVVIPIAAAVYFGMCLFVIGANISLLPYVMKKIFKEAFSLPAGVGGILGYMTSVSVKEGFARGLLSNEAGAGTSTLAHARAESENAHVRGVFGIAEVFFDTVVLCGITALAILISGADTSELFGIVLVERVFSSAIGKLGSYLLFASVIAFALSTVLCQYFYGSYCARYLFGARGGLFYFPLFIISAAAGAYISAKPLIAASDIILFLMTVITCLTLIKNGASTFGKNEKGPDRKEKKLKDGKKA